MNPRLGSLVNDLQAPVLTGLPSLTFYGSGSGINNTYPCPCRRLSYVNLRSRCKDLMRRQTAGFGPEHLSAHSILHWGFSSEVQLCLWLSFPFPTELCKIPSHLQGSTGIQFTQKSVPISLVTLLHSCLCFSPQSDHLYSNNT